MPDTVSGTWNASVSKTDRNLCLQGDPITVTQQLTPPRTFREALWSAMQSALQVLTHNNSMR